MRESILNSLPEWLELSLHLAVSAMIGVLYTLLACCRHMDIRN
ncbi:hypothetical protein ACVLD2_002290 [Paenibacillus sp. PvR052]